MARARTREGAPVATMACSAPREMTPATSAGSMDVNGAMRSKYRSRRCPRWRLRDGSSGCPIRERGAWVPRSTRRAKTLLVDADGGEPFEKMHETKDGIVVWMRASDDKSCAAKEVMAQATFRECTATQFWRAVRDVERYAEFVPFVKTSFAVKKTLSTMTNDRGNRAHEKEKEKDVVWAYNRVKPPVASARDYCVKMVSDANVSDAFFPRRIFFVRRRRQTSPPRARRLRTSSSRRGRWTSWKAQNPREVSCACGRTAGRGASPTTRAAAAR